MTLFRHTSTVVLTPRHRGGLAAALFAVAIAGILVVVGNPADVYGETAASGRMIAGGGGGSHEPDAPTPTEPFGHILQITKDGRLFAALYLPGLPSFPELESVVVERAWADEPAVWSPVYTFSWNEDWYMFTAAEDDAQGIYYPFDGVPNLTYLDHATTYRSFYLRARIVHFVDDALVEDICMPVLFSVPNNARPGDEVVETPGSDAGGAGGDKGGIGQGEHERPVIEAPTFGDEAPDATSSNTTGGGRETNTDPISNSSEGSSEEGTERVSTSENTASNSENKTSPSLTTTKRNAIVPTNTFETPTSATTPESAPVRLPGILAALAGAIGLAAGTIVILHLRRTRAHRAAKAQDRARHSSTK